MTEDRRSAFRRNAFTFGAIEVADGTIACLVWDATERGAQIEVEAPDAVPERFLLRLSQDGTARPAAVAWRGGHRIGVSFED